MKTHHLQLKWMDPKELNPNPLNWRKHPRAQKQVLSAVLEDVGWAGVALYNEKTGNLIDGHARREWAIERGCLMPVLVGEWNEDEERKILATLDPIASLAKQSDDIYRQLLETVQTEQEDLSQWLKEQISKIKIPTAAKEDPGPKVEKADELRAKWKTETGQIWEFGPHRLVCGDCTDSKILGFLMQGEKAVCCFTDPPYGVDYSSKNEFLNLQDKGNKVQKPIKGDDLSLTDMYRLWLSAFRSVRAWLADGATYYVTGPQGGELLFYLMKALTEAEFPLRHMLIWSKNNHVLGRCDYHYKHEPILYGWLGGAGHRFYADFDVSVWEIARPQKSELHPTMKPVELYERGIKNSTVIGDLVIDPFSGSGTCAVACIKTERVFRGVELAPEYCAVILERVLEMGFEPRLVRE